MNIEVLSNISNTKREQWTFWLDASVGGVVLHFDSYGLQDRLTARHKWIDLTRWNKGIGYSSIQRPILPESIVTLAKVDICKKIMELTVV